MGGVVGLCGGWEGGGAMFGDVWALPGWLVLKGWFVVGWVGGWGSYAQPTTPAAFGPTACYACHITAISHCITDSAAPLYKVTCSHCAGFSLLLNIALYSFTCV